jgi:hypothetical protein
MIQPTTLIAVEAEHLKSGRKTVHNEPAIDISAPAYRLPMLVAVVVDMIDTEKLPARFSATDAHVTAVSVVRDVLLLLMVRFPLL